MRKNVTVAAVQMSMIENDEAANIAKAVRMIRQASSMGGQIILLPELFTGHYFPKDQLPEHFELAQPLIGHPMIISMQALARELEVVLPVSFYERDGLVLFNSVAVIDADGSLLGVYRKSHIPDGTGWYFSISVWKTTLSYFILHPHKPMHLTPCHAPT